MRYVYLQQPDVDVLGFSVAQFVCGGVLLIPYALFSGDPGSTDWGQRRPLVVADLPGPRRAGRGVHLLHLALGRWPGSRVYAWTFLAPVVAVVIEALRGNLPVRRRRSASWSVIAGVAIVNLPRAEAPAARRGRAARDGRSPERGARRLHHRVHRPRLPVGLVARSRSAAA